MDFVTIKTDNQNWGKAMRSDDITGLLIASLPPVGRPKKRVMIEEIDGRDGDIVTDLGWSAYDKKLGVGLYGQYDVEDVLDFFKEQGQIIFSNEPDKYYSYAILNNIDLERVIRFKKGVVTLHVQPYKYSAIERSLVFTDSECKVFNYGNIESRPTISITGSGTVTLSINESQILTLVMGENETTYVIDSEAMEVYSGVVLKNRQVTGNYDRIKLKSGTNTLSWTGNVSRVVVERYSRWI